MTTAFPNLSLQRGACLFSVTMQQSSRVSSRFCPHFISAETLPRQGLLQDVQNQSSENGARGGARLRADSGDVPTGDAAVRWAMLSQRRRGLPLSRGHQGSGDLATRLAARQLDLL